MEAQQVAILKEMHFSADDFPVDRHTGQTHLDSLTVVDGIITISGWAFFDAPELRVMKIAVIDSEKRQGLGYADISVERPDVKKIYGNAPVLCGFEFQMPLSLCSVDPEHVLMLYGIDETFRTYMKISGLHRLLPLDPFMYPDDNIDQSLISYLTTARLSWVDITATHRCNIDCRYCCLFGKHDQYPDADIEKLVEIVDAAAGFVGFWQMSCLGEITVYPHWLTLAKMIMRHGPFTILSNFSKRFGDDELLMLARAKYLTISIDTTDRALQREIRKGADVARIVANIVDMRNTAVKAGLPVPIINLSSVISPPIIPYLPSLALLAVSLGVRHMLIQNVSKVLLSGTEDVGFTDDEEKALAVAVPAMLDILDRHGIAYTLLGALRRFNGSGPRPNGESRGGGITKMCLAPWERMYMGLMGELVPCAYIGNVGLVKTGSDLKKITNGTRMRAIRRGLLTGELEECCANCRYGYSCSVAELIDRIDYYREPANADDVAFGLFE
jgi:MoaA/NifB/PqqE/SkfB family radical SAM enzyme